MNLENTLKLFAPIMGGDYTKYKVSPYLSKHGIKHQNSVPYTSHQNRVVKRKNKTSMEMTRCMLHSKGLHKILERSYVLC